MQRARDRTEAVAVVVAAVSDPSGALAKDVDVNGMEVVAIVPTASVKQLRTVLTGLKVPKDDLRACREKSELLTVLQARLDYLDVDPSTIIIEEEEDEDEEGLYDDGGSDSGSMPSLVDDRGEDECDEDADAAARPAPPYQDHDGGSSSDGSMQVVLLLRLLLLRTRALVQVLKYSLVLPFTFVWLSHYV